MADAVLDIEFAPGLGLPFAGGAEQALITETEDPFALISGLAGVPLTLTPTFSDSAAQLADVLAAARQGGCEPPDLFAWYFVACPEETAEAVAAAIAALPYVLSVTPRVEAVPAAWTVVTDPDAVYQRYLRPAPSGVGAYAAWQVAGGDGRNARVADVEYYWDFDHPDLAPADVVRLQTPMPQPADGWDRAARDHGTASLGVVGARSTGEGLTGISPAAALAASPISSWGSAFAIARAAAYVGLGGVVLLEVADCVKANCKRDGPDRCTPDVAIEVRPPERAAIAAASALGVLVVEPAGNAAINLDTDVRTPTLRRFAPGIDSGALIVAAGSRHVDPDTGELGDWIPADFTTYGQRVDCFGPGVELVASASNDRLMGGFGGTSGAGAIVAGVAAALQGVAIAAGMGPLRGERLRAMLCDPQYGTLPSPGFPATPIGAMPDLEKLVEGLGAPRLPPPRAVRLRKDAVLVARPRRGLVDELDIVVWDEVEKAWTWTLTQGADRGWTSGHPIGLHVRDFPAGLVVDAVCPSTTGVVLHRPFSPDIGGGFDGPWQSLTHPAAHADAFRITTPLRVLDAGDRVVVSGLAVDGTAKLFIAERKPNGVDLYPMPALGSTPGPHAPSFATLDLMVFFNAPPAMVYDAENDQTLLAGVDRDGQLWFGSWSRPTGTTPLELIATGLDPTEAPALVWSGRSLHVLAVGATTRLIRETVRTVGDDGAAAWSDLRRVAEPPLVTWGRSMAPAGPLEAASDGAGALAAIALTAAGWPVAATRPAGLDWSPLEFVPSLIPFATRAGVTIASPSPGVFLALACDDRGALYAARWTSLGWLPFQPI